MAAAASAAASRCMWGKDLDMPPAAPPSPPDFAGDDVLGFLSPVTSESRGCARGRGSSQLHARLRRGGSAYRANSRAKDPHSQES